MSIRSKADQLLKGVPFLSYVYLSLGLNFACIILILGLKNRLPPVAPLFYGAPSGTAQLVTTYELLIAPGVSIVVTILNVILITRIEDIFLKKILIAGLFLASILTTITIVKIIFLIGFF